MAPFPETEIMTIKRLEVALRRMDFKLLKDGAYKLHEKFHSGHKFEYLDLLKEIFSEISTNSSIPNDIKDILVPTIEDILAQNNGVVEQVQQEQETPQPPQGRVSSLTSLSYGINQTQNTHKIDAFEAFGSQKVHAEEHVAQNIPTQSPFSAKPFREFSEQEVQMPTPNIEIPREENNVIQHVQPQEQVQSRVDEQQYAYMQPKAPCKTVAIFYSENSSFEKTKNILRLRELISRSENEDAPINEILKLISEINVQTSVSAMDLSNFLEQIKSRSIFINFITNSQSSSFFETFKASGLSWDFFKKGENKNLNFMPLFGLSNLFRCSKCQNEYLDLAQDVKSYVLECPSCKAPMFPDFYSSNGKNCNLNINYYNASLNALANSDIWVLIEPSADEKITPNLLRCALQLSNRAREIFILDKDINKKEVYKNMLFDVKPNIGINIQPSAMEDFLNLI